ncbi:hypothetical protein D9M68_638230 [compost metagenome]
MLQSGDHALDIEHGIGQFQQFLLLRGALLAPAGNRLQLRTEHIARRTEADHVQGLAQLAE